MSLPTLRNRLGGRGPGESVVDVPKRFGDLAVAMAAAFVMFCVDLRDEAAEPREAQPPPTSEVNGQENPSAGFDAPPSLANAPGYDEPPF